MRRGLFLFLLLLFVGNNAGKAQMFELNAGWKARIAGEVSQSGEELSSRFTPDENWINAVVPGTVLTTLGSNGLLPDLVFGMNNSLIPDISETGPEHYTYWYYNSFPVAEIDEEKQIWIEFRGVNYTSDIYFNGERLNDKPHKGMFLRQRYNVTSLIRRSGNNELVARVEPPDPPGVPNSGNGGDGIIARSVTMQQSAGWNWVTHVADRNTGIWDKVVVEITGPVDIINPRITSRVPGVRTPGEVQSRAFVTVSAELFNSSDKEVKGVFQARIAGGRRREKVTLAPGERVEITLRDLRIKAPRLWWPNGMGNPNLYQAVLDFETGKDEISARKTINIGIREIKARIDDRSGGRIFTVNGQDIFIRGANWTGSDMMLRHSSEKYETEVKMHAAMNLNMIRVKGSTITERPEFYDACDRYGILVWQDLWITGHCNGLWPDPKKTGNQEVRREYPDDHQLFIRSVEDQVLMLRNHPSLAIWCGGDQFPPPESIDSKLRDTLFPLFDPERVYISSSVADEGMGNGPHKLTERLWFFTNITYPFNTGVGSVGLPIIESLQQFLTKEALVVPDDYNLHPEWEYHKYLSYGNQPESYGEITGFEDFVTKSQMVNYEQYRALQESYNAGMWEHYTGSLIWKSQNSWSSLRGQLYDVLMAPNAGYYGIMNAAKPFHVQMNLNDSVMTVINSSGRNRSDINTGYRLYDISGRLVHSFDTVMAFPAGKVTGVRKIDIPSGRDGIMFVQLIIESRSASVIHDINSYLIAPEGGDYSTIGNLKNTALSVEIYRVTDNRLQIELLNNGDAPAYFTRLQLTDAETGEGVYPVFFEDNYITLMPGSRRYLSVDLSSLPRNRRTVPMALEIDGFNQEKRIMEF